MKVWVTEVGPSFSDYLRTKAERQGRYVEVRLVQQNRVQEFLKKDIQSVGAATGSLENPWEPVASQSGCAIGGTQHFDWLISRGGALPSSLT